MSYPADLYAAVHVGTPGDIAFYRRVTDGAGSVLELGCGYGRVLSSLDASVRVGVDLDPALLAMARARMGGQSVLVEGDLRTVDVGARFDAVIAPYSTLYCLETEADLGRALERARAHLLGDGIFAFDVWYADDFHENADPNVPASYEPVAEVEVDGIPYVVEERSEWDRDAQTLVVDYRHTSAAGEVRHGRIVHRYALEPQLTRLLAEAKLRIVESGRIETEAGESLAFVTAPA